MEKMTWTRPMATVEQFMPNEYIAACGDSGTHYKFVCNATSLIISGGYVWLETNGVDGLQQESTGGVPADTYRSTYSACSKTHVASQHDEYLDGYLVSYLLPYARPVKVWTDGGTNTHCTTTIDMTDWEETKS